MKLATLRGHNETMAVRVDRSFATVIDGYRDLSVLLANPAWRQVATDAGGERIDLTDADYAPVVPNPGKIVCVGLNYASHIKEMGRDLPEYPTLFAKFKEALAGPYDDVIVPSYAASALDWEGELAFVIGKPAYQISEDKAHSYIAGFTVINDYTARDYQYRTLQWLQGKTLEKSSGFGPHLTTIDSYSPGSKIITSIDGDVVQSASTDDLVFTPAKLVEYISHIVTLQPGDVVATGTPGGVGHSRVPPMRIEHGQTVQVSIEGLGTIGNKTIVV
ncbi:2-hydroxyhepta-2,4-diene-1,7-dioate isomerase [Rhodococcus sp. 15-1154-1]|nr:fumarylacetoacetate hydrolase family protein [Rhodococcus sp. 15-1154-1]OZF02505.1 2-hydroxyhepta-2,4-diene-1,7-dioate isomerase [Rhodococcus sp. 15-1154-1]